MTRQSEKSSRKQKLNAVRLIERGEKPLSWMSPVQYEK